MIDLLKNLKHPVAIGVLALGFVVGSVTVGTFFLTSSNVNAQTAQSTISINNSKDADKEENDDNSMEDNEYGQAD